MSSILTRGTYFIFRNKFPLFLFLGVTKFLPSIFSWPANLSLMFQKRRFSLRTFRIRHLISHWNIGPRASFRIKQAERISRSQNYLITQNFPLFKFAFRNNENWTVRKVHFWSLFEVCFAKILQFREKLISRNYITVQNHEIKLLQIFPVMRNLLYLSIQRVQFSLKSSCTMSWGELWQIRRLFAFWSGDKQLSGGLCWL